MSWTHPESTERKLRTSDALAIQLPSSSQNGYVIKAEGEMLINRTFVVYLDTLKKWEEPHNNQVITEKQIEYIINEVDKMTNDNTIKIVFE